MLSDYQLKIPDLYNINIGNIKKLVPNFFDKEKYVLHYENLRLNFSLGLELKELHCILEFNQSQWLKLYIEFYAQKRIKAEKRSVVEINKYGHTIENLRNSIDAKLVNNDYLRYTSKPSHTSHKILANNLVVIQKRNASLKINKPEYIGMCILELSKVLMYELHYDYIKTKYGNKSKLLFTDTDGLIYEIKTADVYEDFSSNKEMFDFSNYSTKSKYYND